MSAELDAFVTARLGTGRESLSLVDIVSMLGWHERLTGVDSLAGEGSDRVRISAGAAPRGARGCRPGAHRARRTHQTAPPQPGTAAADRRPLAPRPQGLTWASAST